MNDEKLRYLVFEQGAELEQYFRLANTITNTVYNFEEQGFVSGRLQVRTGYYSDGGTLLLDLTTDNGGVSLSFVEDDGTGKQWSGYIYASTAATSTLIPFTDSVFDFYAVHEDGGRYIIARGPVMLVPKVSE